MMMLPQNILIGGGVRSGKSAFALRTAETLGTKRIFVATAQAFDAEMHARINAHRDERGEKFVTVECPLTLPETLTSLTDTDVVVVDCLTLWLSNLLLADMGEVHIARRVSDLADVLAKRLRHTVLVTNEVGMGVVPESPLGRLFRDVSGRAHQTLAAMVDTLYMAMLGSMIRLRPGPLECISPGGGA